MLIEKLLLHKILKRIPKILRHIITIFLVIIGWVIFRVTNLSELIIILKNMFVFKEYNLINFIASNFNLVNCFYYVVPAILLCIPWKNIIKIKNNKYNEFILIFIYLGLYIIDIIFLVSNTYNPFIYFRF